MNDAGLPVAAGHGSLEPRPILKAGEPHRRSPLLRYPESWLLIVLVPALVAGLWLGVSHHHETIDFQPWWLLPGCGAVALEGIIGGWLFGDHAGLGQMAGIGAVCSWVTFGVSVSVAATGSVDPGGFGWPEATVVMSGILFAPTLLGAGIGSQLRHHPVATLSGIVAAAALFGGVIVVLFRILGL